MLAQHQSQGALATLAIRQRTSSRYLLFDANKRLSGWQNINTNEKRIERLVDPLRPYAFSGIHIINPRLLSCLPQQQGAFSIIPAYLDLAAQEQLIGYPHDQDYWFDVGKPERLEAASNFLHTL